MTNVSGTLVELAVHLTMCEFATMHDGEVFAFRNLCVCFSCSGTKPFGLYGC